MIPIRDNNPSLRYPVVTVTIIVVNIVVFVMEMGYSGDLARFLFLYGLVPVRYSVPDVSSHFGLVAQIVPFFSFMFLHGGIWHLISNMWFLYVFGDNVEDHLGSVGFLVFYLLCGWASGVTHFLFNIHSQVPTIGASGAIAGVMGAYLLLYPRARVLTLIPIFIIPYFIEVPAAFFLGFWFFIQFLNASLSTGNAAGIAWWAHIGGFLCGIMLLVIFRNMVSGRRRFLPSRTAPRKGTPKFHVFRPAGGGQEGAVHGILTISAEEAATGTKKLVNIPEGFRNRFFRVTVPPGVKDGTTIRLSGVGTSGDGERPVDAFLKVSIQTGKR